MHIYFSGRQLTANDLSAEQQASIHHGASSAASSTSSDHHAGTPNETLLRSLPTSFLDAVALNPQPLPPKDHHSTDGGRGMTLTAEGTAPPGEARSHDSFPGAAMSLGIGTSLAAYAAALEHEASSLVLYNGHAGLGANAAGPLAGASVDDEVQVAFEHGQLQGPFVAAPLWNEKAEPPTHGRAGIAEEVRDALVDEELQERTASADARQVGYPVGCERRDDRTRWW